MKTNLALELEDEQLPLFEPVALDKPLTILSFGAGQDSTAILYKLVYDPCFRAEYAPGRLLVIMAETSDEHYETRAHVAKIKTFCAQKGVEFVHITPDMGHHRGKWIGWRERCRADNQVGSKALSKTCTARLKLEPMGNFIEWWLEQNYPIPKIRNSAGKPYKKAFYHFKARNGRIVRLVGIAAGEEKRIADPASDPHKWSRECTITRYPLVELGMDRQACQDYIRSVGHEVPLPSNCMTCPFLSEKELLWLYRTYPQDFFDWCDIEAQKMAHFKGKGKNHGVWPTRKDDAEPRTLKIVLAQALEKYGHLNEAELLEYKMSHGHCVASKY